MESFSQGYGYKPVKSTIQIETMDDDLRNGLWNALCMAYWDKMSTESRSDHLSIEGLVRAMSRDYFKLPVDAIPSRWSVVKRQIRDYFFQCQWNEVYDFIQFVANNYSRDRVNDYFMEYCNSILEREVSGYRFIDKKITPITAEEEIAEIEEALRIEKPFEPVVIHLKSALDFLSDRESPDYRNSIKESISAVEAMCILIAGSGATLGKALGAIQRKGKITLHESLRQALDKLYGYTSDADGIRHALMDEPDLGFEDAKFMLVSCSAFINYLKVKSARAEIKFDTE